MRLIFYQTASYATSYDPPVNTAPGSQSTNEDTNLVFSSGNGNQIALSDIDAGSNSIEVTVSVTNGKLTLAGTTGLTFTSGDGSADNTMTFRGTLTNINTALNGLTYAPTAQYNGGATLTIISRDNTLVSLDIDANLQAHYTFEGNINDSGVSPTDNGTLVNGATYVTDGTRGQVLSLDGLDDYVQITGTVIGTPVSTEVTIGGWVNLAAGTGRKEFISLDNRVHIALDDVSGVKGSIQIGASSWIDLHSNQFIAGTGWHHVMYTYSDSTNTHSLYIDGARVASATIASSVYWTGATNTYIGRHPTNGWYANAKIDDVRIYNRVLNTSEVASLASDLSLTDTDTVAITVTAVNDPPSANAAGPYAISEGQSLTLNAGSSSDPEGDTLTYAWDLDNDGNYGEVGEPTTINPTVTWATLQSYGIADNGSYTIGLRVSDGTTPVTTTTTVNVSNTAPALAVTGSATANSGGIYTLNLSDIDPGNDTISSWIVNWGDGSISTYIGDPSNVTHTYSNALTGFTFSITASAIDEDGQYYEADMWLPAYVGSELDVVDGYVGNVVDFFAVSDGLIGHANVVQKLDGNFLISGHGSSNVLEYQPDGTLVGTFIAAGSGGLNGAAGMDFGADGNLYITSSNSGKVLRFDGTTGAFIDEFVSSGLNFPLGLTFGPDGDLYVASQGSDGVLKFDGITGILDATFNAPPTGSTEDITFGPDGNLYVSSFSDGVFRLNGATGALIDNFVVISAAGVEFGPDGNLYVSDQNANVVRRYDGITSAYIDDYIAPGGVPGPAYMVFTADHQVTVVASVAPTITNLTGDSLTYSEGDGAVVIEQGANALVSDADSTNFDTGTLTISISSGLESAEDVLSIRNQGTGAGQIGVSGSTITYGGTTIGTFTGGSSGSNLVITLNSNATPTAVTSLVKNITYQNTDTNAPTTGARTVSYILTDGDGGTSANYDTTVTVGAANDAPTFGVGDGQALTSFGSGWEFGKETVIQPDGKILVGGYSDSGGTDDFCLARYNADGTLDTSFGGGDGVAFAGIAGRAETMVLQADGKVVLSGYTTTGGYQVCLVRFNADGTLDTSFGGGDGVASSGVYGSAQDVALQSDGKLLVAADLSNSNFNLMRFNSDGALDTSFGGGLGYVSTDLAGSNDRADSLTIQSDGKVVLSGFGFSGTSVDFALVRYNTDGSLDTSFNGTGKVLSDFGANSGDMGNEVRMQADGKIVVAGWSDTGGANDFAIARYNANGTLDAGFGTGGKVTINLGGSDLAEGLTIQADGKILVTGTAGINGGDIGLVRLNTDGTLDTTFGGGDGIITSDYSGASDDRGYSVAVQSDGRIVVSGTTQVGGLGGYNVALNRYSSTGSLDTTLDSVNTLNGTPTYTEGGSAVVLDADVQIFDAELSTLNNFNGATLTLARNGGGNPDDALTFDGTTVTTSGPNLFVSGVQVGTFTFTGGELIVTFGSNATQARVNTLMQNIVYWNWSEAPPANVQIDWTFSDGNSGAQGTGGALQATGSMTVTITAVNDVPTITNLGGDSLSYNEGNGAIVIEQGGNALVADVDSTNLDTGTLTVSIPVGGDSAEDVLSIRNQGTGAGQIGVSGSTITYGGTTIGTSTGGSGGSALVITLNSNATPTAVTTLIKNITYENTDTAAPTTGARTVRYVLTDGDGGTSANYDTTVTVSGANDAPVNTVPGPQSVTEDAALALSGISVNDVDGNLSTVQLAVGNGTLNVTLSGGATISAGSNGTTTLTLSGSQTDINATLASLTYQGATDFAGADTLTVTSTDSNSGTDVDTVAITVTGVNDAPIRTSGTVSNLTVSEDASLVSLGLGSVTYSPGGGADESGQTLTYAVTVIPSASVGDVFLADGTTRVTVGSYTLAEIQGMQFKPAANASGVTAFQFNVSDSGGTANGGADNISQFILITVNAVNDAPTMTNLSGDSLTYNEGDGAVVIEQGGNATVNDVDSADFNTGTLTVRFTAGSDSAEDVLSIRNQGAGAGQIGVSGSNVTYQGVIIGTFTGGSSGSNLVVTLNSSATSSAITALVQNITYENTDTAAPTTGVRTVRYVLTDGDGGTSANYDTTATITAVNDAPTDIIFDTPITLNNSSTNGYIGVTQFNYGQPASTQLTFEMSFSATSIPSGSLELVSYALSSGTSNDINIWIDPTGDLWFRLATGAATPLGFNATSLIDGNQHQLSITWDGATGDTRFYTDGSQVGATTYKVGGSIPWAAGAQTSMLLFGQDQDVVGGGFDNTQIFAGNIFEVRIFTDVRTAPEIAANVNTYLSNPSADPNLLANWRMVNDGSGFISDLVGSHDLTLHNAASFNPAFSVAENSPNGTHIASVVDVTDADISDSHTFSLTNDAGGAFTINPTTGQITVANTSLIDYETATVMNITVRATDSTGAFYEEVVPINVLATNDAPVLANTALSLTVAEDAGAPSGAVGSLISAFTGGITDADSVASKGIAITGTNQANGTWYYTTNGGTTWTPVGTVSNTSALLLADNGSTRLYFAPATNYTGTSTGALTLRAWDQTSGTVVTKVSTASNGGTTTFSTATDTVDVTVSAINDVPVLALGGVNLVVDGSFEAGGSAWTSNSTLEVSNSPGNFGISPPPDGTHFLEVEGWVSSGTASYVEQTITTVVGRTYVFSLAAVNRNDTNIGDMGAASVNGVEVGRFTTTSSWQDQAFEFTATSTSSIIRITSLGSTSGSIAPAPGDGGGLLVDNVRVVAVNDSVSYTEGGIPVKLATAANVVDPELSAANNFTGATLTLARSSSASSQDAFSGSGTLSLSGGAVVVGGTTIGTYTNSGGTLVMTFNGNATNTLVNSAMQQIAYSNSSDAPPSSVQINWTFSDGNTGAQGSGGALTATGSVTVNITAVDDAPTSTGGSVIGAEDTAKVFSWSEFNVSDVDTVVGANTAIRVTALPADGTLQYYNGSTWIAVSANQVLTKSTFDAGYVRFVPDANESGYDGYGTPGVGNGFQTYAQFNFMPVQTTPITIINPGGESQTLAENSWIDPATGWTTSGADAGAQNLGPLIFPNDEDNSLYTNAGATLSQTLGATFDSTNNYSFSFEVGWRGGYPTPPDFRVELWAGSTRLGYVDQTAITQVRGLFASGTLAVDGASFSALNGQSLEIRLVGVSTQPNFDNLALTRFIRATDIGSAATMSVDITPANDAPTDLSLAGTTVAENAANGTVVGTVSGTDPDSGDTKTYSFTDNAGGRFAISSSTGQITVANGSLLDYEAANNHNVTVRITDSGGLTYDKIFAITLTNVNETPTDLSLSANTITENATNGTVVGMVSGTDPDSGDTKTYSFTDNAGGRFAISSSTGQITVANGSLLDYEATTNHNVTVRVTDSGGLTYDKIFAITLTNVNETPTDLSLSANTITENATNGTVVGMVSGTDPDSGDTKTYSFTDNAGGRFAISSSTGQITVANGSLLDYEAATNHNVTVRVTDSGGLTYDETFTINVTNVNDAPTGTDATITIIEDTSHTLTMANFGFSDADAGDSLSAVRIDSLPSAGILTLSGTNVMLNEVITVNDITTGNLVFTPASNANGTAYASFTFSVRDSSSAYDAAPNTLTFNVTAVNDAPINSVPGAQTVSIDTPLMISGVSVNDVDGNLTTVQLSVTNGTMDITLGGAATISAGANGTSTVTLTGTQADINLTLNSLTYQGNSLFTGTDTLTIISTDGSGATDTDTITITVSNNAPSNQLPGPQTVTEDTTLAISGVSVTDIDGNVTSVQLSATYGTLAVTLSGAATISSGNNGSGSMTLSGIQTDLNTTLASLTYQGNPNFAGLDTLVMTSTDSTGTADTNNLSITVVAVNDAPTDLSLVGNTFAENAANGTSVGTVSTTDPDSGDTKTYSLTDTAGGRFAIDSNTGEITVANGSLLNYEAATSHNVTVRITDSGGLTYDETFTINLNNANETPTDLSLTGNTVAENAANGTSVGAVSATDPDSGDTKTYSLTDTAGGRFAIDSNTGEITVANGSLLNYEAAASHNVTVRITDSGGLIYDETFTINLNNANETPTDLSLTGNTVAENAANGTSVGAVSATDPDSGDTKTYSLTDTAGGRFAIDSNTGEITVANGSLLNYEAAASHNVTVRITDSGGLIYDETFTINLNNANETPTDLSLTGNTVTENAANGTSVGTVSATDPGSGDTKTYSLTDTAGGRFAIDSNTGEITVANGLLLNYEAAASHNVTVRITDSGGLTYDETFTINLNNANEIPTDLSLTINIVAENAANGTFVGTIFGTDPDSGDTKTYSFTDSAGGRFAIDSLTGQITVANGSLLDYEAAASHSVTIRVTDSGGLTYDETFTINLININEPPTGADATVTINEDASHTATAANFGFSDVDAGDSLSAVRIDTLPGAGSLTLSGVAVTAGQVITVADITAGNLVFTPVAGANGTGYASFTFSVRDSNNTYDAAPNTLTVNVTAQNDAPTDLALSANTVAENAANGTSVGTVSATDPDSGDTKAYSLTDTAGGRFAIDSNTGEITVANGSLLNYEAATSHNVTVRITDSGGLTYDETFTINLNSANETPINIVPGSQIVNRNTPLTLGGIFVSDANDDLNTVRLIVEHGTLKVTLSGTTNISAGSNGTSSLTLSGSLTDINATLASLIYQGNYNYIGIDTLNVVSSDSNSAQDIDTVVINVVYDNSLPVGLNDSYTLLQDSIFSVEAPGLLINDSDADNNELSIIPMSNPENGALVINSDGSFIYTPNKDFVGVDSFTYVVHDGYGDSSPVTVMLIVNPLVVPLPETPSSLIVPITLPSTALAPITDLFHPSIQGTIPFIASTTVLPAIQNLLEPTSPIISENTAENARLALQPTRLLQDHDNSHLPEHWQEINSHISHALLTQNTVIANQQLWEEVENIRIDIQKAFDEKELTANVASVAGISLTAGIVGWLIRSGSILASLLSIIPAWKSVDPLSIVIAKSDKDTHESLEDDDDTKQKENSAEKLFYPDK